MKLNIQKIALILIVALATITLCTACTSQQIEQYKERVAELNAKAKQVQQDKDKALAIRDAIVKAADVEIERARTKAQALPEGESRDEAMALIIKLQEGRDKLVDKTRQIIDQADAKLDEIAGGIDGLDKALADVDTPAGAAGVTFQQSAPYVPAPWNLIIGGIGSVLLAFQERQRRRAKDEAAAAKADADRKARALQSTVEAFEIAKRDGDGTIDFNSKDVRRDIRATMGYENRSEVDAARLAMAKKDPSKIVVTDVTTSN